jgi:hypothetical protein
MHTYGAWNSGDYRRPDQLERLDRHDRGFYGRGPRGYTRSDTRILEDACDRLTMDPRVDASGIEVKCDKGTITLAGTVTSREQKHYAEEIVEDTLGVTDVDNNLRVSSGVLGSPGAPATPLGLNNDVSEPRRR